MRGLFDARLLELIVKCECAGKLIFLMLGVTFLTSIYFNSKLLLKPKHLPLSTVPKVIATAVLNINSKYLFIKVYFPLAFLVDSKLSLHRLPLIKRMNDLSGGKKCEWKV